MSRVQEAFQGKKAFIPFITCGDPDLETTEQLVYAMEQEGASLRILCDNSVFLIIDIPFDFDEAQKGGRT